MEPSHYNFDTKKKTEILVELKYWRPISLLCTDYKILTKPLSNRIKEILPNIISIEQSCSVPQRTIFNNLFLIGNLIKYKTEKTDNFYLIQIDQEKAFDKIDRPFLFKTMEKLGISKTFINFIEILYKQNIDNNKQRFFIWKCSYVKRT